MAKASAEAGARIGAARPAHLDLLRPMAGAGTLILGVPLLDPEGGGYRGSLMLVRTEALEDYLAAEPFRHGGVWESHAVHPFRLAPLPYPAFPEGPVPERPTHAVAIAWDGTDGDAGARRLAVRERHLARVRPAAEGGVLALGGAILDAPGGAMIGSVAITAHASVEEARGWWAEDPYVEGGVWQTVSWYATRIAPLPYRDLPRA
ncbi:YciI family protein [Pararoseomonas sp. SCSIO 73927]|uniref:YciI family protein n=1 Tax=Pararoseomonas sp. SCSIO 73927 TaxID=3114537 RepID=UPI0030D15562